MITPNHDKPEKLEKDYLCATITKIEKTCDRPTTESQKETELFDVEGFVMNKEEFGNELLVRFEFMSPLELLVNQIIKKA